MSDRVERYLQVANVVVFGLGELACTQIDLQGRQDEFGHAELAVTSLSHGNEFVARHLVVDSGNARIF